VILVDKDGDRWSKLRVRSTGDISIGFWKLAAGQFCIVAFGKENPARVPPIRGASTNTARGRSIR
jgi:hypothetical protein